VRERFWFRNGISLGKEGERGTVTRLAGQREGDEGFRCDTLDKKSELRKGQGKSCK